MVENSRTRTTTAYLFTLAIVVYARWLTSGGAELVKRPAGYLGLTFNSMLEHLLRGQFDVDPAAVGIEGFSVHGRIYAYWGIFCALLRLPLLIFPNGLGLDVTCLSCLVAVALAAFVKLEILRFIFRGTSGVAAGRVLYWALALTILFSGAQIQFLKSSLYQEVCLWAGALGTIFVYCALRGLLAGGFSTTRLCAMALVAGLALLARVSTGVGLYAATALLLLGILILPSPGNSEPGMRGQDSDSFWVRLRSTQLLLPVLVLAVFAGLTGFVNYERWGHPLVFADYQVYLINIDYPDWPLRAAAYGLFNVARIPFGIVYYFFPIWVINRSDGRPLFDELQTRLLDSTELPPASFLLTDALLLALMVYALWSVAVLRHQLPVIRSRAITIGAGLSAPCLLMLCAISMNHRYRIDFYPFIEFGAFLGVIFMLKSERLRSVVAGRAALLGAALSIGGSHVVLVLYKLSSFGPAIEHMRHGFFDYYLHQLMSHYPLLARWIPT